MDDAVKSFAADSTKWAWAIWVTPLLILLAGLPLGCRYLYFLTGQPQYEFAVVFLIAWLGILLLRRRQYFGASPQPSRVGTILGVTALMSLCVGILLPSSWFVYLAFILEVGSIFVFIGNRGGEYPLLPVWLALLIPLRLPLGLDIAALNQLRLIASKGASRLADLMRIPHLLEGNVFSLKDKEMFMDDACSGIISLLTCIACAALVAIWRRRGVVHFVLLLFVGGLCAILFNILRVTSLLAAWHWFAIDLSTGWKHDLIGYFALAGGVGSILACDIGLNWLFADTGEMHSRLTEFWNRALANPPAFLDEPVATTASLWKELRSRFRFNWRYAATIGLLTLLIIYQAPKEMRAWNILSKPQKDFSIASIKPAPFPETIFDWRRDPEQDKVGFWRLEHEIKSSQGAYQRGGETMIVAVAYPYDHWHDITRCYTGHGWRLEKRSIMTDVRPDPSKRELRNAIVHLEMYKSEAERASVLFAFVDPAGRVLPAPRTSESTWGAIQERFGFDQEVHENYQGFLIQALWPNTGGNQAPDAVDQQLVVFEKILDQIPKEWTQQAEPSRSSQKQD